MSALPPTNEFTGPTVTQGQFKTKFGLMRDYLAGLLGTDGLASTARIALGLGGAVINYNNTGAWLTAHAYAPNDLVTQSGIVYNCITGHTSGTFATDLASGYWVIHQGISRAELSAPSGSSLEGHIASGTGSVATTVQNKLRESVSVKDFGAIGNGVIDDTAAIQNAINYIQAITPFGTVPTQTNKLKNKPAIYLPAGTYKVSTLTVTSSAMVFYGNGPHSSCLMLDTNTDIVVIDMGTFSSTPSSAYTSGPQDCMIQDIGIFNNFWGYPATNSIGTAIRLNGCGGLRLNRVRVSGFGVGVNSPYGGDYNEFNDLEISGCVIGLYQGPGGQQTRVNKLQVENCVYGVVLDKPGQIDFNMPVLNNCMTNAIRLEGYAGTATRYCSSVPPSGTYYESQITINNAWFEGNAGGLGGITTYFIYCDNVGSDAYRNIHINNPIIAAGTDNVTFSQAVVGQSTGMQRVFLNYPVVSGVVLNWFYNPVSNWFVKIPRVASGYTSPAISNTGFGNLEGDNFEVKKVLPHVYKQLSVDGASGTWTEYNADTIRWGFQNTNATFTASISGTTLTVTSVASGTIATGQTIFVDGYISNEITISTLLTGTGTGPSTWTIAGNSCIFNSRTMKSGTILYRIGMDVQNSKLFLGDVSTNGFCISRAGAMPTTGNYAAGSFVYNTLPVIVANRIITGWQRITTGSAHVLNTDWVACYVATV